MRATFEHLHLSAKYSPLAFVAAALIAGIALSGIVTLSGLAVCLFTLLFTLSLVSIQLKRTRVASSALLAAFVCGGFALAILEEQGVASNRLKVLYERGAIGSDSPSDVEGSLVDEPERGPDYADLDLVALRVKYENRFFDASGVIEARLLLDSPEKLAAFETKALHRGSRVRVLTFLQRTERFQNPGVSDYTEYLDRKGYDLSATIKSPLLIDHAGRKSVALPLLALSRVKTWLEEKLDASLDPRSAALVKAVALGNRNYLDEETIKRFRAGGTFHLLVISGVHLAFLAWLLFLVLSLIGRYRRARIAIVLVLMWSYAVMVGLQPPVSRATLMITMVLLGRLLFREARALNTLSLAAIVLLAIKPSNLWDPGFQLSFVAVALIVFLPGPIYEKLRAIGSWQPKPGTPYPPASPRWVNVLAGALFWDQQAFEREQSQSPITYKLRKSAAARWLRTFRLQWMARWVVAGLITSALVQLGLLPISISYFNRIPIAGVWLNLVTSILLGVQLALSFTAVFMHSFFPSVASMFSSLAQNSTEWVTTGVNPVMGTIFSVRVPHLSGKWLGVYVIYYFAYALLIASLARWNPLALPSRAPRPRRSALRAALEQPFRHPALSAAITIALLVAFSYHPPRFDKPLPGHLRLSFLDVGQGDCALLEFPGGSTMLIDGGGRPRIIPAGQDGEAERPGAQIGERVVSRFLWQKGIRRIDYVLATHGDSDHTQGLGEVVENFEVGKTFLGPLPTNDPEIDQLLARVRTRNIPLGILTTGSKLPVESADVRVMWPPVFDPPHEQSVNNDSVVLLIQFGDRRFLLTGDIESAAEESIVATPDDLRADLLKVPHHGSRTSSTPAFLERVQPAYSIISVGRYSVFGHPHSEVVARLQQLRTNLFITGCSGAVTAETDGRALTVSSVTGRPLCPPKEKP